MKKLIVVLTLLFSSTLWAGTSLGTMDLSQTISCPDGGEIEITGTYGVVTFDISADLTFNNCKYAKNNNTITLNGSMSLSGTLPSTAGDLNLTMTYTDLEFDSQGTNATENEKCSGSMTFKGDITNSSGTVTHSGSTSCTGSGSSSMSIENLISDILYPDLF
jgi:phage baseplate assembly protein gpV